MPPEYSKHVVTSPINKNSNKKHVLIIPGFLTEKTYIKYGLHEIDALGHLHHCDWYRHFITMPGCFNANIHYYNWASQSSVTSCLRQIFDKKPFPIPVPKIIPTPHTIQLRKSWKDAVEYADRQASYLVNLVRDLQGEVFVIGHSLGGRIALRLLEKQDQIGNDRVFVCALAPAIMERELYIQHHNELVKNEIFYSRHDIVLRFLFGLGEGTFFGDALGLVGPSAKSKNGLKGIDISSRFFCKKVGHTDYEEHFPTILALSSSMWQDFMSDVYLGDRGLGERALEI